MSSNGLRLTLFRVNNYLEKHAIECASEAGISALSVADYVYCTPKSIEKFIEMGLLPGYKIMLMHEGKHVRLVLDENIMDGFTTDLYKRENSQLTDRERMQLQIAQIIYTSVDDAKTVMASQQSMSILLLARKICADMKSLTKALNAEIKRRQKSGGM